MAYILFPSYLENEEVAGMEKGFLPFKIEGSS